jgi:putative two-component system response regulator
MSLYLAAAAAARPAGTRGEPMPLRLELPEAALPASREACALPILLVEDEPAVAQFIRSGLVDMGYAVEVAEDVEQAKRLLCARAHSLILSDYDMPGGTGLDLLAFVSQTWPDLPFILLTAHDRAPLACEAITSGALDFVSKPVSIKQLARRIEQNRARVERDRLRVVQCTDDVLDGTLRALVRAVDAKDPNTACHSERVTRLAIRLGEAIHLSPPRLRVLEFAALLHDVGKIGVPDQILRKPGRLDESEWAAIKEHPGRSAEIVGEVGHLAEVAAILRHHHERVDGGGYPDGLAGTAIPTLSRIIAIADVYEALTSRRSYRGAMSPSEARAIIHEGLGTHFDRQLGELFLALDDLP